MNNVLLKVALRQGAIYVPQSIKMSSANMSESASILLANCQKLGFSFSEDLLHALNGVPAAYTMLILNNMKEVLGLDKNWTPLVKNWEEPVNVSFGDYFRTFINSFFKGRGTIKAACGHIIPENTFPLERYNGCPFCGMPAEFGQLPLLAQGSTLKVLELWTEDDASRFLESLLTSKTALDATQIDSLNLLLAALPLPNVEVEMKETLMLVIDALVKEGKGAEATRFFKTPTDVLRYIWFKNTGNLQLVEPKTIIKRVTKNSKQYGVVNQPNNKALKLETAAMLKLKINRKLAFLVATWLNNLDMSAESMCENMHPKRNIWVRLIRAARLAEFCKRKGFNTLAALMDCFYNQRYTVWQGLVDTNRKQYNASATFQLLKQRPSIFARSLFSNILWFGPEPALKAFAEVANQVPARLLLSLNMYAINYFDAQHPRTIKPLGGISKAIQPHALLTLYNDNTLKTITQQIEDLTLDVMGARFRGIPNPNKSIYIDPCLFKMPIPIGDRAESVQDLPAVLMGTRFPLEGSKVRLFLQWGQGLPAMHLDMDLSCHIIYPEREEICAYYNLAPYGCQHSGDVQHIPNKIGTAEYINLNVEALEAAGALFALFTCNAYTAGSLTPNLVVGWMDSNNPMVVSYQGVAYDPSTVQHQVRITQTISKGLVFGVLDVKKREIIWLEMPFSGAVTQCLNVKAVEGLFAKLNSKLSIGNLLAIKANYQNLTLLNSPETADEVYDSKWAVDTARVTKLLVS